MILHTVKTSPFQTFAISDCLKLIANDDSLLLIEDAVVASTTEHPCFSKLKELAEKGRLMVLQADLDARGLENKIGTPCSYLDFVKLVRDHQNMLAW